MGSCLATESCDKLAEFYDNVALKRVTLLRLGQLGQLWQKICGQGTQWDYPWPLLGCLAVLSVVSESDTESGPFLPFHWFSVPPPTRYTENP